MVPYFRTFQGDFYLEISIPEQVKTSSNNIIFCVDSSGSMKGTPLDNVKEVLLDIFIRTKTNYKILRYDTKIVEQELNANIKEEIPCGGCTFFKCVFDKATEILTNNPVETTFIFMTDGEDTSRNPTDLKLSMNTLKLTTGVIPAPVTFHVIGFSDNVKVDFLESVRKIGNKEGLFKHSTKSKELQNDFNDMLDYAASNKIFEIQILDKKYEVQSNVVICTLIDTDISTV